MTATAEAELRQLGGSIRSSREKLGWTQEQLAQAAGVRSISAISRIENGSPTATPTLVRVLEALHLKLVVRPAGMRSFELLVPPGAELKEVLP